MRADGAGEDHGVSSEALLGHQLEEPQSGAPLAGTIAGANGDAVADRVVRDALQKHILKEHQHTAPIARSRHRAHHGAEADRIRPHTVGPHARHASHRLARLRGPVASGDRRVVGHDVGHYAMLPRAAEDVERYSPLCGRGADADESVEVHRVRPQTISNHSPKQRHCNLPAARSSLSTSSGSVGSCRRLNAHRPRGIKQRQCRGPGGQPADSNKRLVQRRDWGPTVAQGRPTAAAPAFATGARARSRREERGQDLLPPTWFRLQLPLLLGPGSGPRNGRGN
mmetsp:Transcript_107112/g.341843  ORF Transcript_107112/g.341843 Transcript_107112/m.341843 type:complete len:282 (+) Transcript_107112:1575-2420(+)